MTGHKVRTNRVQAGGRRHVAHRYCIGWMLRGVLVHETRPPKTPDTPEAPEASPSARCRATQSHIGHTRRGQHTDTYRIGARWMRGRVWVEWGQGNGDQIAAASYATAAKAAVAMPTATVRRGGARSTPRSSPRSRRSATRWRAPSAGCRRSRRARSRACRRRRRARRRSPARRRRRSGTGGGGRGGRRGERAAGGGGCAVREHAGIATRRHGFQVFTHVVNKNPFDRVPRFFFIMSTLPPPCRSPRGQNAACKVSKYGK